MFLKLSALPEQLISFVPIVFVELLFRGHVRDEGSAFAVGDVVEGLVDLAHVLGAELGVRLDHGLIVQDVLTSGFVGSGVVIGEVGILDEDVSGDVFDGFREKVWGEDCARWL